MQSKVSEMKVDRVPCACLGKCRYAVTQTGPMMEDQHGAYCLSKRKWITAKKDICKNDFRPLPAARSIGMLNKLEKL